MIHGYPYAAKAVIQHEFTGSALNIWLTFDLPMNQKHKPLDTVWFIKIDSVVKAVASSAWQDAFTMLLTVSSITSRPAQVLVKFDGPDSLLETTWLKNWEPWGYILSVDYTAALIPVGFISLWHGSITTIPSGWALCDGTLGTPNLVDRMIICSGNAYPVDSTGGAILHFHSVNKTTTAATPILQAGTKIIDSSPVGNFSDSCNSHTHAISGNTGQGSSLAPYYALAYIMKL